MEALEKEIMMSKPVCGVKIMDELGHSIDISTGVGGAVEMCADARAMVSCKRARRRRR